MLTVIVHLFILTPIFTQIKYLPRVTSENRLKYAALLLGIVFVLQLVVDGYQRNENIYDLMELSPKGYTHGQLKKSYYTLSKQYHPDKNPSPEAAEMFQKVKLGKYYPLLIVNKAYEIL